MLYLLAAAFAVGEIGIAVSADYREWGEISLGPYLAAALACELYRRRRRPGAKSGASAGGEGLKGQRVDGETRFRRAVVLSLLVLTVALPLGLQLTWRASAPVGASNPARSQAQPEVAVIERAGDRLAAFKDPYLSRPKNVGVSPSNDSRNVNASSFFPYLPGMVPFGLPNAAHAPPEIRDARLTLGGFTLLAVALALALAPVSSRRRWRAFQFLIVLPTGALPMVTGGDDLPVLALLLLGLVLVQRRQPVLAGLAMGVAGTLKWTAWPLVLLAVLSVKDDEERPAVFRYSLSVLGVAVPVIAWGAFLSPHAFFENVVMFPLGLTRVHSPAASPLPGQVLVQLLPAYKRVITLAVLLAGAAVVGLMLVRRTPRDASSAAAFTGLALAFATFIAPATRFGYFIYPANMLVWAYLLRSGPAGATDLDTQGDGRRPTERQFVVAQPKARTQLASASW